MRLWNFLSITPDSGQMCLRFPSAIYRDRCTFLDLELVITCNRSQSKQWCPMWTFPPNHVQSLPANRSWPQYSLYPHATCSIVYILSNRVSGSWNIPSLKLSANFCHVLSVLFRYTEGTYISTILASLDFTSRSSDYVLSKAGLLSAKLSQTIIAWTQQWINTTQNHQILLAALITTRSIFVHVCQGERVKPTTLHCFLLEVYRRFPT